MKWEFKQDITIDGVEFKKGDTIEGVKGIIDKDAQGNPVEGLWVKWHTGKKLRIPITVLSPIDTNVPAVTEKSGKSLLQAVDASPLWTKAIPFAGLALGLGFAHHKGGKFGRYAGFGIGMTLLASIPLMMKIWDNLRSGTEGIEAGMRNQILQNSSKQKEKAKPPVAKVDPAQQEKFVADLTNASGQLIKSSTGIAPDAATLRTASQIFQQAQLDQSGYEILLDYINTSTQINIKNLNEEETELTLKPMYDHLDELQKKVISNTVLVSVIKQLTSQ